jgi:hypothetical protein
LKTCKQPLLLLMVLTGQALEQLEAQLSGPLLLLALSQAAEAAGQLSSEARRPCATTSAQTLQCRASGLR